jgi:3D (Asp-Asp-Asp) domain-containing protein
MGPVLSESLWRRLIVAGIAIGGFVLLYEVNMFDSHSAPPPNPADRAPVVAGNPLTFTATAYCKGTTTAAGIGVRSGVAAADPAILPLGSIVNITTEDTKYQGVYTILDTGPAVQGRHVDLYMWSCIEALDFGRQQIELTVLRLGWDPEASAPSFIDRLFRRRETARTAAPRPRQLPEPAPNSPDNTKGASVRESDGATQPPAPDLTPEPSSDP